VLQLASTSGPLHEDSGSPGSSSGLLRRLDNLEPEAVDSESEEAKRAGSSIGIGPSKRRRTGGNKSPAAKGPKKTDKEVLAEEWEAMKERHVKEFLANLGTPSFQLRSLSKFSEVLTNRQQQMKALGMHEESAQVLVIIDETGSIKNLHKAGCVN
jgi:hypothetical protein